MGLLLFVGVGLKNGFSGFGRVFLHLELLRRPPMLDLAMALVRELNLASEHTHSSAYASGEEAYAPTAQRRD